ncbi:phosphoenolpyruvate--protein phosphotransferase [bacterium]|nr:phosphoenolpyruvate--protein phosphotransferase [bacterium]
MDIDKLLKSQPFEKGVTISGGISFGKAYILFKNDQIKYAKKISYEEIEGEIGRFYKALENAKKRVKEMKKNLNARVSLEILTIFDAQYAILSDPLFIGEIVDNIKAKNVNAEYSTKTVANNWKIKLQKLNDPYFKERTNDINELAIILIEELSLLGMKKLCLLEPAIIVAEFITLSELVSLEKDKILGFVTSHGGYTSHLAIVARALNIPALSMINNIHNDISHGDDIIIDGLRNILIVKPKKEVKEFYIKEKHNHEEKRMALNEYNKLPPVSNDGVSINFEANLEIIEELPLVEKYNASGIGLFRTEFLIDYTSNLPGEKKQTEYYSQILNYNKELPVTMRTFDIGGDKMIQQMEFYKEENPFLGWRAIRFQMDNINLLKTQLRAFFISNSSGNLKILFPMISQMNEIKRLKETINEVKQELENEGVKINAYKIGIMVEIPSAAIISDLFAKEVDFISIGTNDLTQYTLAVDRGNEKVQGLFNSMAPSVLRLIKIVNDNANMANIPVAVCGEMSGKPLEFIALLIVGIRQFSLVPWKIPIMKKIISTLNIKEIGKYWNEVKFLESHEEVREFLIEKFQDTFKLVKSFTDNYIL